MGRARKLVRKPMRASPATMQTRPVIIASVMDRATARAGSPPESGSTMAATMAHVAPSGARMSCRDVPSAA
jgi:hypothetical protein